VLSGFLVLVLIVLFVNYEWIIKKLENTGIGGFIKNSLIFNGAFIIFSLIISAGILVTFSRIGWILMGFLWMLWLGVWINKKNKKLMKYYLIFLGVSFIGAVSLIMFVDLGIFVDIRNRLLLQSLFGDVSWQQRIDLAQKALKFTRKNLLFGTGFGNFLVRLSEDPIYMDSGIRLIQPAHNIFLMILVESGILGTLLIFVIVGLFIKLILSTHKINKNLMISLLALILLAGNLDHYLITLPQGLAMLCLLMPLMLIFPNGLKQG
jgi:O-antigen ligase